MKTIHPNLYIKILNTSQYCAPEKYSYTNRDLLDLNPTTKILPKIIKDKLAKTIQKKFGFQKRSIIRLPQKDISQNKLDDLNTEDILIDLIKDCYQSSLGNIDLLVHGSTTQSRFTGSQSTAALHSINQYSPMIEMKAGCSTSLASLYTAILCLSAPQSIENVLIACSETLSKIIDPKNREHWFGFADGGAALWVEKSTIEKADFKVHSMIYGTDGEHLDSFTTPGKLPPSIEEINNHSYSLKGNGDALEVLAKKYYNLMFSQMNRDNDLSNLKYIIPHQVNMSLIHNLMKNHFHLPSDVQVLSNSETIGNIGGSSVLYSLCDNLEKKTFQQGEKFLLMSVGGGLTYSMHLWEKL